jgi:hypothetical protein
MMMFEWSNAWPWITLALLGAFHGANPAMGWLFAVALGCQERRMGAVVSALGPIAAGHALAIACVAVPMGLLQVVMPERAMLVLGGCTMCAFAGYKIATRLQHPRWIGMRVTRRELASWSVLMAAAHGAGLMLIPALATLSPRAPASAAASPIYTGHEHHMVEKRESLTTALAAVSLHTLAMLAVMSLVALVVYRWVGVEMLRRAWINLDWLWIGTLVLAGFFTLGLGIWSGI